jgi:hypothetical protein
VRVGGRGSEDPGIAAGDARARSTNDHALIESTSMRV